MRRNRSSHRRLGLTIAGAGLFSLFGVTGCAPKAPPTPPASAHASRPEVVGEITVVDEEKHFVLIDLEANLYVPPPDTPLQAIGPSGKVAHLKASPEQKRPFIAADILDGNPAVGDEVTR